jgi:predicted RNA-binding protein with PIN domain
LPTNVRRFKGFRQNALPRHSSEILNLLDDAAMRARIAEWLDKGKPSLSKPDAETLRLAVTAEDGDWKIATTERSTAGNKKPSARKEAATDHAQTLERERDKTKKAKEELRRAKEEAEDILKKERARAAALEAELTAVKESQKQTSQRAAVAEKKAVMAAERADREVRRARRDVEKLQAKLEALTDLHKAAKSEIRRLTNEMAGAAKRPASKLAPAAPAAAPPRGPRKPLPVPKGRYQDAPETLAAWLDAANMHLVVDGYNVTKAEGGYGGAKLESQRERLVVEVAKLLRKHKASGTIVFDGSEVQPGTARRNRGPVKVEYSAADEIADDHIVALIERLPAYPVILATNDRELQDRGRALGATVATSNQLLVLLR